MHGNDIIPAQRVRAFPGDDEGALRAGHFFAATLLGSTASKRYCADNGLTIARAQGEGVGTAGGFLVPIEIEREVFKLLDVAGICRRYMRVRQMGSDSRSVPRRVGGLTAYFVGEGQGITESQGSWDNVNLAAKKLAVLTRFSTELAEDEVVELGREVTEEVAYAVASKEDDCGINGDGTSTYGGIVGVTKKLIDGAHSAGAINAATGHDTFAEIDAADLGSLIAACPEYALESASWFASSFAIGTCFARLGATAGGAIMTANGPRPQMQYLGWPIVPTPKLPGSGSQTGKAMILFGDLRLASSFGSRRGMTIATSPHRYMELDQVGIRGTSRFDINVHDLGSASAAGPVVGLIGGT
jgi:HK97 family phage major capsid protein